MENTCTDRNFDKIEEFINWGSTELILRNFFSDTRLTQLCFPPVQPARAIECVLPHPSSTPTLLSNLPVIPSALSRRCCRHFIGTSFVNFPRSLLSNTTQCSRFFHPHPLSHGLTLVPLPPCLLTIISHSWPVKSNAFRNEAKVTSCHTSPSSIHCQRSRHCWSNIGSPGKSSRTGHGSRCTREKTRNLSQVHSRTKAMETLSFYLTK